MFYKKNHYINIDDVEELNEDYNSLISSIIIYIVFFNLIFAFLCILFVSINSFIHH